MFNSSIANKSAIRNPQSAIVLTFLAALTAGGPVSAHHSFAAHYVEEERVSIEGDLVQLDYRSPHSWVYVNAKDQGGVVRRVSAEWASAPRLKQSGVTEETLKIGDHVIISGSPSRDPNDYRMHLKNIQRPSDGWRWPLRIADCGLRIADLLTIVD